MKTLMAFSAILVLAGSAAVQGPVDKTSQSECSSGADKQVSVDGSNGMDTSGVGGTGATQDPNVTADGGDAENAVVLAQAPCAGTTAMSGMGGMGGGMGSMSGAGGMGGMGGMGSMPGSSTPATLGAGGMGGMPGSSMSGTGGMGGMSGNCAGPNCAGSNTGQ